MNKTITRPIRSSELKTLSILALCLLVVAGCAKFTKQQSENIAPFSTQTISMIGGLERNLSKSQEIYLRRIDSYVGEEGAPTERIINLQKQVDDMLTAITVYSIQIVTISEQSISENKKANLLADVLEALQEYVLNDPYIKNAVLNEQANQELIAKVRQSEDYLGALRMLSPSINEFSAHAGLVLDELEKERKKLQNIYAEAIDVKYGRALEMEVVLRAIRNRQYDTMIAAVNYRNTHDPAYIDEMRKQAVIHVKKVIKNKKKLSDEELRLIHDITTDRLSTLNEKDKYLSPDIEDYHASHRELQAISDKKEAAIRESRHAFIVWARAYQRMAAGKTDPAEWFDISDSGTLLFGAARRAVF